jgi:MFS family permease
LFTIYWGDGILYKDLFKNPNFALLSIGGFISSIGDYLYNIGITVFLYSMTKSVYSVAMMWLSRAVLRIPMLYLSGIIADKYNRKHVIVLTNLISVVIALLFIFAGTNKIWLIYLGTFSLQSLNDIDVNSETAILPEIVSKDQLSQSNSIFSFLQSTSVFLSPALGGILYKLYGANVLFIINAVSFLIAGILFAYIKYSYVKPDEASAKVGIIKSGLEGYKVLSRYTAIKALFIIMSIFAILGRFYETYKVAVSDILLGMKPEGIIYFDYALAIGGLSVPFIVKALVKHNQMIIFTISTMAVTVGFTIFGYSHSFIFSFIILIVLGAAQNIQGTYSSTIIQNNIPKNYIERVFSFYKMLITFFAILGLLIATPFYNFFGIGNSFLMVSIVLTVLCAVTFKFVFSNELHEALTP